jgi:hypothetical protein
LATRSGSTTTAWLPILFGGRSAHRQIAQFARIHGLSDDLTPLYSIAT